MIEQKNKVQEIADDLGISVCLYPPQDNKQGFMQQFKSSQSIPVTAQGDYVVSAAVLPSGLNLSKDCQKFLEELFKDGSEQETFEHIEEKIHLDAIIQTFSDYGSEMQPLLRLLREKAENDDRLASLIKILEDRLSSEVKIIANLAPREAQVLELAAKGMSNAEIAKNLGLQTVTINKALSRAYRKLDAKNRTEAVHKWIFLKGK